MERSPSWEPERIEIELFIPPNVVQNGDMLPPELHESPDGEIRLVGHRITLYDVARRVRDGLSTELIQRELPTLDYAILNRVVEFIHDNPDLITTVIEEADREIKSQIASMPPVPSRAELRSRFDRIMARQSA